MGDEGRGDIAGGDSAFRIKSMRRALGCANGRGDACCGWPKSSVGPVSAGVSVASPEDADLVSMIGRTPDLVGMCLNRIGMEWTMRRYKRLQSEA